MSKLKRKRLLGKRETYDLTASKNHNFIADGVVVHNCAAVIDEANIKRKMKAIHEKAQGSDRTEAIYQAIRRRIRMTFDRKGGPPTLLMTIGSRRYPSDFCDRRIRELVTDRKALVMDMAVWDAKGRENFSDKAFKVMIGNDATPSKILADGEAPLSGFKAIEVPEDFRKDFEGDCDSALRDCAGIAVRTILPYFANQMYLKAMVDTSRKHPCKNYQWKVNASLEINWDQLVTIKEGKARPLIDPEKPRCVAVDLGRVRNSTGLSVGYVKGFKTVTRKDPTGRMYQENLPYIVVDFILEIMPVVGEEVKFWQVRELIFKLIEHGIPIKMYVGDHFQSDDMAQILSDQGITTERIKTDYKSYDTFKACVYEERFRVYEYPPLMEELSLLEDDPKRRKVDIFSEEPDGSHHDVCDSAVLLACGLSSKFNALDYTPVSMEMDVTNRKATDPNVITMPVGGDPEFEMVPGEKDFMSQIMNPNQSSPQDGPPAYGIVGNDNEAGWGEKKAPHTTDSFVPLGSQPIVRIEVLAGEFCRRVGIESVQSVELNAIKLFLFEKGLADMRYATAIKNCVESIYGKKVV
jgi:hypothetical protein